MYGSITLFVNIFYVTAIYKTNPIFYTYPVYKNQMSPNKLLQHVLPFKQITYHLNSMMHWKKMATSGCYKLIW